MDYSQERFFNPYRQVILSGFFLTPFLSPSLSLFALSLSNQRARELHTTKKHLWDIFLHVDSYLIYVRVHILLFSCPQYLGSIWPLSHFKSI